MNKIPIILTSFLLAAGLYGCDAESDETTSSASTQPGSAADKAFDSCNLLTTADIRKIFPGVKVNITTHGNTANQIGQRICFYSVSDDDMKFVQTSLMRTSDMAGEAVAAGQITKNIFISTKSFVENKTDVPGLGEEAYYGGSGLKAGAGLHILVNDNTSINISVGLGLGNDNREEHLADEKKLAQIILPQL